MKEKNFGTKIIEETETLHKIALQGESFYKTKHIECIVHIFSVLLIPSEAR